MVQRSAMAAGGAPPVRERSELRREQGSEKKKENGMIQSQKLLLTWLIEHTGLFPKIEKYISPEDFTEEIYHKAAEILYEQYRNTGTVNPAKIVSMFQMKKNSARSQVFFMPSDPRRRDRRRQRKWWVFQRNV